MNESERTILPSNIKQVGTLSDEKRVYVEDYAATYLQQYANADSQREKAAFLIGQEITVDGSKALFISGVVQGKYSVQKNGVVQLTEKSRQYAQKQIDIYFKGLDIVGWAYIQPGYEDSIKDGIRAYHEENMDRGLDVMLLIDPVEKINSFFVYNEGVFSALKGYIIYYEKNEGMHEYMLENKLRPTDGSYRLISEFETERPQSEEMFEDATPERMSLRETRLKRRAERKTAGLMSGLSFVMLMVCFVMGAGLVQNDKRINDLESNVAALKREFAATDSVKSVFAAENPPVDTTQTTAEETTAEPTTQETTQTEAETMSVLEYRVEQGDTLSRISEKIYGTIGMIENIMQLNGMEDADDLKEGMELVLPQ